MEPVKFWILTICNVVIIVSLILLYFCIVWLIKSFKDEITIEETDEESE